MIHRGRTGTLVLLLFTMACGGGATGTPGSTFANVTPSEPPATTEAPESPSTTQEPGSPFTEVTRSIVGIIPAVDIGEDGQPVDPGFRFSPDAPQITIVVQAGEVTGSAMDLTWFQVTEEGEEELFTHSVEVASFQTAYSVGRSPGSLSIGTYRVEASFEGESSSTSFEVEAPETEAAIASIVGGGSRERGAIGQGATSGPPASGDSGAVATPVSGVPAGDRTVRQWVGWAPGDSDLREILFTFDVFRETLSGGDWEVQAQATMGGNTRTVYYPMTGMELRKTLTFDPCVHPGGSDLPGTQATFFVAASGGDGSAVAAGDEISTTLGPDESRPEVTINSVPPNKSRVKPGDEIVLDATARESREQGPITLGPTWQEGLNSFKLIANPGGLVGEEQRSDAGSPQPCEGKQWSLTSQATYTVPDDAPTVIKICGEALDFAGNFSDPNACNEYYTAEGWEGDWTDESGFTIVDFCPQTVPIQGTITLVVADDGSVSGSFQWANDPYTCGGPVASVTSIGEVTGERTADGFILGIFGAGFPLSLTRQGNEASGKIVAGGNTTHSLTVRCVTCEP